MKKIFINVNENTAGFAGWTASIATAHTPKGSANAVASSDSVIHMTRDNALKSIEKRASKLNYITNDIRFNITQRVGSFDEVVALVEAL